MGSRIIFEKNFWLFVIIGFSFLLFFGHGGFFKSTSERRRLRPFSTYPLSLFNRSEIYEKKVFDLAVYYSSFSPESRKFVLDQLVPTMEKLSSFIGLTMIPYGATERVESKEKTMFFCEHGETECHFNKFHSCMLQSTVDDGLVKAKMIGCLFEWVEIDGNTDAIDDLIVIDEVTRCSKNPQFRLRLYTVRKCAEGIRGIELMKENGRKTDRVKGMKMPVITINGHRLSPSVQTRLRTNLFSILCEILSGDHVVNAAAMRNCSNKSVNSGGPDFPQMYTD